MIRLKSEDHTNGIISIALCQWNYESGFINLWADDSEASEGGADRCGHSFSSGRAPLLVQKQTLQFNVLTLRSFGMLTTDVCCQIKH